MENLMEKLVSIIMPAYNTATYITRGIESCLEQRYANWELLVVDDDSTDNTVEKALFYAEKEVRIRLIHIEHGGVSLARNRGMDEAKGEYLLFLDSDDWLEPDALEKLLILQKQYPECLVACDRYGVKCAENGEILERDKIKRTKTSALLSRTEALKMTGRDQYNNSSVNKLFQRNIIEDYRIRFRPEISYGEDELFVFQYLLHVKGMFFTENAYWNVLERPGSATRNGFRRAFLTSLEEVDDMMKSAEQNEVGVPEEVFQRLRDLKVEKARNLLRRYLDADAEDPEALWVLRHVLRMEGRQYCQRCSFEEKPKIYAAAYCPWKLYRMLYRKKG